MKIYLTLSIVLIFGLNFVHAQRSGYIDSNFLLSRMPEYKKAQDEIARLAAAWVNDTNEKSKNIEAMYASLQAEEILLTDEMKAERLKTIHEKEQEKQEFYTQVFGNEGLYFKKRQELINPLLGKIGDAVEKVSKQNNLAFIFDKAAGPVLIYTDPRFDYSDLVLDELGLGDPNNVIKP